MTPPKSYQPYPHPNKAIVKALWNALRAGDITRAEFAACIKTLMGPHRTDGGPG